MYDERSYHYLKKKLKKKNLIIMYITKYCLAFPFITRKYRDQCTYTTCSSSNGSKTTHTIQEFTDMTLRSVDSLCRKNHTVVYSDISHRTKLAE